MYIDRANLSKRRISMNDKVAIYCRLSEEDKNKKNKYDDSGSIKNQKLMLTEYANNQNWIIYNIYSDDDYSGSDRERPAFNKMIEDAGNKKFNIILCKSQSRFTRELELVEIYLHNLLPQLGIRFVSIIDNIDTNIAGNKKARQINGLINEWYLEELSASVKSGLKTRTKNGFHIGSFAPYGYKKDPDQKGHLIIDEEAAEVVRYIFELYNQGIGKNQIAKILNEKKIPNPSEYKRQKGLRVRINGKSTGTIWKYYTVSSILTNEVYIGNLIQGKTFNPTYKSKHAIPAPKENWIKVENTHKPIIDMETWNTTQRLWKSKTKPFYNTGRVGLFSGKVVCKYCGYNLVTAYTRHNRYFRCPTRMFDKNFCKGTTVLEKTVENEISKQLKKLQEELFDESSVENKIKLNDNNKKIERLENELKTIDKKNNELIKCLKNLYLDKIKGVISEEQFLSLSEDFESEQKSLLEKKSKIQTDIEYFENKEKSNISKKDILAKYLNADTLTRIKVENLIDKIEIGGTRNNREIDIFWNF